MNNVFRQHFTLPQLPPPKFSSERGGKSHYKTSFKAQYTNEIHKILEIKKLDQFLCDQYFLFAKEER